MPIADKVTCDKKLSLLAGAGSVWLLKKSSDVTDWNLVDNTLDAVRTPVNSYALRYGIVDVPDRKKGGLILDGQEQQHLLTVRPNPWPGLEEARGRTVSGGKLIYDPDRKHLYTSQGLELKKDRLAMVENAEVNYSQKERSLTVTDWAGRSVSFPVGDTTVVLHQWKLMSFSLSFQEGNTPHNYIQLWVGVLKFWREGFSAPPDAVLPGGWVGRKENLLDGYRILPGWWNYGEMKNLCDAGNVELSETRDEVTDRQRKGWWGDPFGLNSGRSRVNPDLPLAPVQMLF